MSVFFLYMLHMFFWFLIYVPISQVIVLYIHAQNYDL